MLVLRMVEERFHRDDEGRPIREGRTPPELLRGGEIEYRRCPYPGSRHLHANPMNASALRQTSAHWDTLVAAVQLLRRVYATAHGSYRPELWDIWRVGQLGNALPWFYILRRNVTCPAYAAALSKVTLGVGIWAQRVFVDSLIARRVPGTFTSQEFLDTAEANGTLIAATEVCAASDKMIVKFFDAFVEDGEPEPTGELRLLVEHRDELARFGAHYTAFKQWLWLYWLARRFLFEDLIAAIGEDPELRAFLDQDPEPPDFFAVQPERVPELPLAHRAHWFRGLAATVVPFSPDGSDRAYATYAGRLAELMGEPPASDDLATEIRQRGFAASDAIGRAIATYAALDALLGDVIATTEAGFRDPGASPVPPETIDAGVRDRVLAMPPRALFTRFAPQTVARIARP